MDFPSDAFHTFLDLNSAIYLAVKESHKPPGFYLKYLKLCFEDEQSFCGVGKTCGNVNNDKMIIFGVECLSQICTTAKIFNKSFISYLHHVPLISPAHFFSGAGSGSIFLFIFAIGIFFNSLLKH